MSSDKKSAISMGEEYAETERKLFLLYLIDKMDALTKTELEGFVLRDDYMEYFDLQNILAKLSEAGYIETTQDNNAVRFSTTEDGRQTLDYFEDHIPIDFRLKINKYAAENNHSDKHDNEISANYFYDFDRNEFIVKCGVYECDSMLMEVSVNVVNREQAKLICSNWKNNVNQFYIDIFTVLTRDNNSENKSEESGKL
ncbi:MAG: DUF4364 family protein [Clostridiales bacterium]|nr:DUF4364 family protein [Clostridiales bacterium]